VIVHTSTRRDFLRNNALAAAGLAGPYWFTSKAARGAESKNDRLNVAAIGVGRRGSVIGRNASQIANLVACADAHLGNAAKFVESIKKYSSDCNIYQDYREVLARSDIDAVTIGTPDHWHVKIAIDAMKAGKHVYCEKPLTLTLEEGDIICEAVKKYGKTFQVGTHQRSEFGLLFLKAVAIARSGRLGQNLHAISSVGRAGARSPDKSKGIGPFPTTEPPADLNWDLWLGQAPAVPFCIERGSREFRWWFEYSGGQVTDWGVHHTDIAFWALAGKDGQILEAETKSCKFLAVPREQVLGFLLGQVPAQDMPNAFNAVHEFDVNLKLSTGYTITLISGDNELLFVGENGRIRVNRDRLTGKPVEDLEKDAKGQREIEDLMVEIYGGDLDSIRDNDNDNAHMQNFVDCIKNGKRPVANVWDHVRAVNACHFANIAMLVDRKLQWDPQAKHFVGDEQANALRCRKQRAPYQIEV